MLTHTLHVGRQFNGSSGILNTHLLYLVGFSDADFAGCVIDRKSTSGTCHFP
jgi:hypothetical protein